MRQHVDSDLCERLDSLKPCSKETREMAMKFRKRIKIAPGVNINLSKSGISTTVGPRGASANVGKKGAYLNTGIPGTGIYDRTKLAGGKADKKAPPQVEARQPKKGENFFMFIGVLAIVGFVFWLLM